ncbi:MAG TPA: DUF4349 domain-containing protein [Terriglobales bacterium]|nr:DUF4349 domain-containing protein [Terriglobales bacterium]
MDTSNVRKFCRDHVTRIPRYAAVGIAILIALNMGWVRPLSRYRGIAESKATGLGAVSGVLTEYEEEYSEQARSVQYLALAAPPNPNDQDKEINVVSRDRKMVRSASFDLLVSSTLDSVQQSQRIAESVGGFVVSSDIRGDSNAQYASMQIRVPARDYDDVRSQLRKLARQVLTETTAADDVTRQYVDSEAALQNYRAEEVRYRDILNRASTVKDILEVTEKLHEVRREIEKREAEFKTLTLRVATCLISLSFRTETELKVFGIQWRPLWEIKMGLRTGLESLVQYLNGMLSFAFHLPAILLWCTTILVGMAVGWRLLRWALRLTFSSKPVNTI